MRPIVTCQTSRYRTGCHSMATGVLQGAIVSRIKHVLRSSKAQAIQDSNPKCIIAWTFNVDIHDVSVIFIASAQVFVIFYFFIIIVTSWSLGYTQTRRQIVLVICLLLWIADFILVNSSKPSNAYMHQLTKSSLVHTMARRLIGAEPLSEPMPAYC